ncbi:2-dehydro-3-deoxygluconokinase [Streptomyces sp. Ru73]|uniref:sugar kinase n=1 Tax=Streptomyces sp. Ru73 TaxID=2080748 RepID=UPI000CDD1E78|nr:sugar kinase [Streptomyces sp. Ru73]POX36041.1 2-dehydro-3-deoxygluconokinase [Streptomyces sp. Ru73]
MKPTAVPATGPRLDVVTFGEVMGMLVAADTGPLADVTHYTRSLAGAELNVATGLVRLGHTAGWVGRVGDDPLGAHALAALRAEGVDTTQVTVDPEARTGFQLKSRVTAGDPEVVYFRKHSAGSRLAPSDAADAYVRAARHLHVTGIPAALSGTARAFTHRAMAAARDAGLTLSFDPNLRPALWPDRAEMVRTVNDLAVRADWVLPGLSEGRQLTGAQDPADVARWYLARGVRRVVLKDGARGATLYDAAGGTWTQPVFPVRAVDTVGAGDGFAAGLISAHLDGLGPQESLARAAAVGALATTSHGDRDGLPTRARLESFLRTRAAA